MVATLQRHPKRLVTSLMLCTAMFFSASLTARAQQAGAQQTQDLEQQLQQLKQQYDETTQSMQQRIAALEQLIQKEAQIQKQKEEQAKAGTVSAVELAAEKAAQDAVQGQSDDVGAKFQGQLASEPTYDLLREADQKIAKLQEQMSSFESPRLLSFRVRLERRGRPTGRVPGAWSGCQIPPWKRSGDLWGIYFCQQLAQSRAEFQQGMDEDRGDVRGKHHQFRQLRKF